MNRTRLSPIDIVGITMGAMVLVVVIADIALIFRGRAFSFPAGGPEMKRFWNERSFQRGGWLREEKEEQVSGDFTTVEIRNIAGGIDIQGPAPGNDTGSNVGIHAVKTAMFPAAMENLNVAIEKRSDRLLIEERHAGGFVMSARYGLLRHHPAPGDQDNRGALCQWKRHGAGRGRGHRSESFDDIRFH